MPKLLVNLTDAQVQFLVDRADPFSGKSGVVRDLIDSARLRLDTPATLVEPSTKGEGSTSKAVTSKAVTTRSTKKTAYIDISDRIAPELSFCRLDLIDWWALRRSQHGKQAVGTEHAWKASQNALLAILRVHGAQVVTDTVQAGLASAWRGFRESYAVLPKAPTPAQRQQTGQKSIDELGAEMAAMPSLW